MRPWLNIMARAEITMHALRYGTLSTSLSIIIATKTKISSEKGLIATGNVKIRYEKVTVPSHINANMDRKVSSKNPGAAIFLRRAILTLVLDCRSIRASQNIMMGTKV